MSGTQYHRTFTPLAQTPKEESTSTDLKHLHHWEIASMAEYILARGVEAHQRLRLLARLCR